MATSYDVNEGSGSSNKNRFISAIEQKLIGLKTFLYSDGKVIGRNAASWGKIGLFYLIYYICLSGFFAITMTVFYKTTDWEYPKLQGTHSLLNNNPGLGFRPIPDVGSTLIRYIKGDKSTYLKYTNRLEAFMQYYDPANQTGDGFQNCDGISGLRPKNEWDKSCIFDRDTMFGANNPCVESKAFSYHSGSPCVILKLNKIYGWLPEAFKDDDKNKPTKGYDASSVSINCDGDFPADKDNIGHVNFYPPMGFAFKYYPYLNQKGYRQPLVFAHFKNITNGVVVMVNCKAYARNIRHNKRELAGSIHFEMFID